MGSILYFHENPDIIEAKLKDYYPDDKQFNFEELN